jgi:hypothetical protein
MAAFSRRIPPRIDCSASRFWGGTLRMERSTSFMKAQVPGKRIKGKAQTRNVYSPRL